MKCYLVGGAVRDDLLGLPIKDRDWVVVGATPEDMLGRGFRQVGADFPVFLHPDSNEEYALARTERKQGHGYHGFSVYSAPDVTLEDDLRRRDLTVNAIARDEAGQLVDPFDGQADLNAKLLRHVSPAFAEDPLRILRTARFAARFAPLGFKVADDTMTLMQGMVADGEVDHLVPERVWQELQRALHEQSPATFFQVLYETGALAVLIPELADAAILEDALSALACIHAGNGATDARFAALLLPLPEPQIDARARAMKAPNDCRDLAVLASRLAPALAELGGDESGDESCDDGDDEAAEAMLQFLEQADAWRKPERFTRLLHVLGCRPGHDPAPATRLDQLRQAQAKTAVVDSRELMAQGHAGKALGAAIRNERLQRIQTLLAPDRNLP
ncbi:multifunctional CCA tRNA nucleotidyl transferase/2'3'-cyclic phosphodiesterase/2'nucleotidase/phosphatase [Marinobacter zhejiangensis]|uniref:CCA-adding enzyme n=1 Tax=Marinobacter zhejiangensis TaxID=488535 RepID=A0A1I4TNX9_9GAMM|nr:multifunctional CCA tRNA nucleotidyl transferase/2'3'-cyclic phosphodiesterase/2'nucleotidase/phosphatase [Marinobacter zhejiangensis]SFM78462.1 tRNA nucleotidyltransferase (CCA-adding enzyme) [Marinobacter zhejiangensis]